VSRRNVNIRTEGFVDVQAPRNGRPFLILQRTMLLYFVGIHLYYVYIKFHRHYSLVYLFLTCAVRSLLRANCGPNSGYLRISRPVLL
jgi:hypothetical protein